MSEQEYEEWYGQYVSLDEQEREAAEQAEMVETSRLDAIDVLKDWI